MIGRRIQGAIKILAALVGLLVVFVLWWGLVGVSFRGGDPIFVVVTIVPFLFLIAVMVVLLISGHDDLVGS